MADHKIEIAPSGDLLVIREGDALPVYEPKKIDLSGDVNAPKVFFNARKQDFPTTTSFCKVSVSEQRIEIVLVGDDRKENQINIRGIATQNPEADGFQLNSDSGLTIDQMVKLFQRRRPMFPNTDQYARIVSSLRNFKANIQTAIEKSKDNKGNEASHLVKQVESGLPETFELSFKPYLGGPLLTFTIETEVSVVGDGVAVKLFCFNLSSIKRDAALAIIAENTDSIQEWGIPVITNFSF